MCYDLNGETQKESSSVMFSTKIKKKYFQDTQYYNSTLSKGD